MRRLLIGVGLLVSLGMRALPLSAQSQVSAGVGAGFAMPFGTFRDEMNPGLRALATLDLSLPEMPVSLRIDAAYDRFGFKSALVGAAGSETGARTIASGSVNLTLGSLDSLDSSGSPRVVSPYAIAGVGMHRIGCTGRQCDVLTQMGWNAGIGARLGLFGLRGFTEARLHRVPGALSDLYYVPVTVGLLF